MAADTPPATPMCNVQIDGVWLQFPKGTRVIEACQQAGKQIPHYCYHPKLSSPGNCRMCLVEMGMPKLGPDRKPVLGPDGKPELNWMPRPQISCAMEVSEGLGVRTASPLVLECRQGVMEFLLINHPLDCPICDQAGECKLQEFAVDHGYGESRFLERKVKKPKKVPLGPRVLLDAERCILCTRCIRFMREVAHDDCIGIVDRGTYNTIACHPDRPLVSNYSLNTVDICPVGALTSADFRFKMRVWFLKETNSICTSCATGCNTIIGSRQQRVYRQTPRENNDVNQCWMCDYGRLNFHYLERPDRLVAPLIFGSKSEWPAALAVAATEIRGRNGGEVAIVASGRMTNEELFLVRKLAQTIGTTLLDVVPRSGEADAILLSTDRNPNTAGARLLGVATGKLGEIADAVTAGRVKLVLALGEDLADCGIDPGRVPIIATNILPNATTAVASVVLPTSGFAEKRGSMINKNGRLQRLNRAIQPPGDARDDWEILRDLLAALGAGHGPATLEELFLQMAAETPALAGMSLSKIGDLGVQLEGVK